MYTSISFAFVLPLVRQNQGNCFGVKSCRTRCMAYRIHRSEGGDCPVASGVFKDEQIWKKKFKALNCKSSLTALKGNRQCMNNFCGQSLPWHLTIQIGEKFRVTPGVKKYFYTTIDLPNGADSFTVCSSYYCLGRECALPEQMVSINTLLL